jgi:hypothetical protein
LEEKSLSELFNLKPARIHFVIYYDKCLSCTRLEISDGQAYEGTKKSLEYFENGRKGYYGFKTYCEELPKDIRTIDVYFTTDEYGIHSFVFHGKTTLNVGPSKEARLVFHGKTTLNVGPSKEARRDEDKKRRKETFFVGEGQELLGWE